jgi:pimeloyl-ACP methyl ester carboxylesterase
MARGAAERLQRLTADHGRPKGGRGKTLALPHLRRYGRLPSLRAPTLVADGRRDILEPPDNSRIIARRIPRARLSLYGAAGHAFLFQRHVDFATRVNSFLK